MTVITEITEKILFLVIFCNTDRKPICLVIRASPDTYPHLETIKLFHRRCLGPACYYMMIFPVFTSLTVYAVAAVAQISSPGLKRQAATAPPIWPSK